MDSGMGLIEFPPGTCGVLQTGHGRMIHDIKNEIVAGGRRFFSQIILFAESRL
jgi:hypothetical protein